MKDSGVKGKRVAGLFCFCLIVIQAQYGVMVEAL
jgi:hypothetical protein